MIAQETIDQINSVTNIVSVIGEFVKLKKDGVNYTGLCPFHNEKSPSFKVHPEKDIYKCFGCGCSGDAVQFLMNHEQLSYVGAIEWLAAKYNITVQHEVKKDYVKPVARLEKLSSKFLNYLEKERGISNNTLLRLQVTEAVEFMPQVKAEVPVMCFNYFRDGELVNIKFRGEGKIFKLAKDAELIFYNLDAIKEEKECVIVEGELDVLTLHEAGIYNVIGVPNGTAKGHLQLMYLDNCWDYFERMERVIICVDDDEVGRILKEELGRRIGKEKCKVVTYPDGCKDSNEVLLKCGRDAVREMIEGARDWPLEGIIPMDDMFDKLRDYFTNGYPMGAAAGVEGFDKLLQFYPGHLTTVTGIPGHGKDEFTNLLMTKLATNHDWKWGVFNFEEPAEIHATKLMEKKAGRAFARRRNPDHRMTNRDFEMGVAFVEQYFHFVNVSEVDCTMEGILKKARELVKRYGIKGLIINPWNYIEHKMLPGQSETHYVSEMLTLLCNFLWKNGVHCFLVAHPTKMLKDPKTGKYQVPTLYSISGSHNFFSKTHNGICVYRNYPGDNTTDVHVQKVKWYWLGERGWANFRFSTDTREYIFLTSSLNEAEGKLEDLPEGLPASFKRIENNQSVFSEEEDLPF